MILVNCIRVNVLTWERRQPLINRFFFCNIIKYSATYAYSETRANFRLNCKLKKKRKCFTRFRKDLILQFLPQLIGSKETWGIIQSLWVKWVYESMSKFLRLAPNEPRFNWYSWSLLNRFQYTNERVTCLKYDQARVWD